MPPKMSVAEKFYHDLEAELMPAPVDDVEAFLNCARYNEDDDGQLLREYLEKHPEDVDARDAQGRTAVHMAAANGHMPILEMLFEFAPLPDVANHEGNTALHFAALNNRVEAARRLIEKGWTASAVNSFNRTAFQLIQGKRFEEMEALLLEHDDSLDAYELPAGSSVAVPEDGDDNDDENSGEEGEEVKSKAERPRPSPAPSQPQQRQQPARAAAGPGAGVPRGCKAPGAQAGGKAPLKPAPKKPEGGVLGTTNLDGIE